MRKVLPREILDSIAMLKSRVSEAVLARGVLIPHPEEEIDVLVERLLEGLELGDDANDRDSCEYGFGGRRSFGSEGLGGDDERADSALGGLLEEYEDGKRGAGGAFGSRAENGEKRWEVKIYAANGLMRASAWAAAWGEMERVDVEILPRISDRMRQELDSVQEEENRRAQSCSEEKRVADMEKREEALRQAEESQNRRIWELEQRLSLEQQMRNAHLANTALPTATPSKPPMQRSKSNDSDGRPSSDTTLPQAYRPKEIPLDVLVRNYIYLLVQDRRNMVIVLLGLLTLFFSLRSPAVAAHVQNDLAMCQPYNVSTLSGVNTGLTAALENATSAMASLEPASVIDQVNGKHTSNTADEPAAASVRGDTVVEPQQQAQVADVESTLNDLDDMMQ